MAEVFLSSSISQQTSCRRLETHRWCIGLHWVGPHQLVTLKSTIQGSPGSPEKLGRQAGMVSATAGDGERTNSQAHLQKPGKIAGALMLEIPPGLLPQKDVDNLALHANTSFFFSGCKLSGRIKKEEKKKWKISLNPSSYHQRQGGLKSLEEPPVKARPRYCICYIQAQELCFRYNKSIVGLYGVWNEASKNAGQVN